MRLVYKKVSWKYVVAEAFEVRVVELRGAGMFKVPGYFQYFDGWLTVWPGYAWDGASGPAVDTADFIRASLVHDALYQAIAEGLLAPSWRKAADQALVRLAAEDGMPWLRRQWVYAAVRWFGGSHSVPASDQGTLHYAGKE